MSKRSFPAAVAEERELFLEWLGYLREAVIGKLEDLGEQDARFTPEGRLIPLIGIVNHLSHVEWRWIDGTMLGEEVSRSEEEFRPGSELTVTAAVDAYRKRGKRTDSSVRMFTSLDELSVDGKGVNLRWVLLHLIDETARHAGHADAVRELLDGSTG